jgi:hypothetical protein
MSAAVLRPFAIVLITMAIGCAPDVVRTPSSLSPAAGTDRSRIELSDEALIQLSGGYSRVLPKGSVWELRGRVPEGAVYRRADGIFTIEGAHIHEAYLVLEGDRLVGFYLPFEQAYSPTRPVPLRLK